MINIEALEFVNSMMLRKKIQLVRMLNVSNESEDILTGLSITVEGEHIEKSSVDLPDIGSGAGMLIDNLDVHIKSESVASLSEPTELDYVVTLFSGENVVEYAQNSITVLPNNYWDFRLIPDTIIEHVNPDDAAAGKLISQSEDYLNRLTGQGEFLAYQTGNPNNVRAQIASLFSGIANLNFEVISSQYANGQFVRSHSEVLNDKKGTELDIVLLMAATLEHLGLHPLLIFLKWKMLVGVWLTDETRPTAYNNEVSSLLALCADGVNRIVVFDVSDAVRRTDFESSVTNAENIIRESNVDYAESYYIDITAGRYENTRLQQKDVVQTYKQSDIKNLETLDVSHEESTDLTRQDIWERKLLDFSLRNTLINMRKSSVLPLISFGVDVLEDKLQTNNDIQFFSCPIHPVPKPDSTGFYVSKQYIDQAEEMVLSGISQNRLYSFCDETELSLRLKTLYRSSRVAMEENGASTLFLNLGILRWYESKTSVVARHAPLVLLPVDLIRKGGASGYVLRLRDEEPMFNITLMEYLKQNFDVSLNALIPLPKDDAGLDIKKIFTIIRHKIADLPRWDLIEEMGVGLFSFNKFVMWNDIHNHRDKIRENDIIRSLLEGKNRLENPDETILAKNLDETIKPDDVALPVDVDSSQLEAIVDAGNERSFILYGPPGTGKSQTITNMIANALYKGKRVLFVAEKRAALEVVESRLNKIGLAPFCLELHSNKVSKQHVLRQLQKATDVRHIKHAEEFEKTAENILRQRMQLMAYVKEMHKKQANGMSLHDCISSYLSIDEESVMTDYSMKSSEELKNMANAISELDVVFEITGHPSKSALRGLEPYSADNDTLSEIKSFVERLHKEKSAISQCFAFLRTEYGLNINRVYSNILKIATICDCLSKIPELSESLIANCENEDKRQEVKGVINAGKSRDSLHETLATSCNDSIFTLDAHQIDLELRAAKMKWFIPRFFAINSIIKRLRIHKPTLQKRDLDEFVNDINLYQKSSKHYETNRELLIRYFPDMGRLSFYEMLESIVMAGELCHTLKSLVGSEYQELVRGLVAHTTNQWMAKREHDRKCLLEYAASAEESVHLIDTLSQKAKLEIYDNTDWSMVDAMVDNWKSSLNALKDWCQYSLRKHQLTEAGIGKIFEHMTGKEKSGKESSMSFMKGVYQKEASRIIESDAELNMFNGLLFDQQIIKYHELINDFKELTKKETYCRLAARVPSLTIEAANNSEVGILKRNISNGGRGTSIRHLIDQIPTLLPKLCPCMLMSPLSVAQYLDIETQSFDLVIFDEASQMPTSEAIGSIARGKALVVVGDPKQMPPTSFFQVQQVDDEEVDIDDLESILDDCISLSLPEHYLSWHYRSRHESLISFSNHQYYDGRLMTFPSSDNRESKVRFIHIDGTYDKGKTRCNKAEAEAIVAEILKRLNEQVSVNTSNEISIDVNVKPDLSDKYKSIGVVSFSKVQQNLIEDLLYEALDKNPVLKSLAFDGKEPIFIKNLENVQGDERDVILFSVGYGPDANGNVSMNFGPLNKQGGERRLNVAVSRARYEMIIYSTLLPEQIDLKRTNARGVAGLRKFLEFAREGRMQLSSAQNSNTSVSGFVNSVAEEIKSMGYKVDLMVGSSHFKVDLAIQNPTNDKEYILGILCDGHSYYDTPTSRDRNMVQTQVLSGLGWHIVRIWSLDWYMHRQQVIDKIQEALVNAESGETVSLLSQILSSPVFCVENDPIEENVERSFEKKDIENVPLDDLKNALILTAQEQVSIPNMDLKRMASKRLGYARMGNNVEFALDRALGLLLSDGILVRTKDNNIIMSK